MMQERAWISREQNLMKEREKTAKIAMIAETVESDMKITTETEKEILLTIVTLAGALPPAGQCIRGSSGKKS